MKVVVGVEDRCPGDRLGGETGNGWLGLGAVAGQVVMVWACVTRG